jgi:hypothetical protein
VQAKQLVLSVALALGAGLALGCVWYPYDGYRGHAAHENGYYGGYRDRDHHRPHSHRGDRDGYRHERQGERWD